MGGHSLIKRNVDHRRDAIAVTTVSLDEFLNGETIDLIEIDAEGSEPAILAGGRKTLARCRPVLFLEVWPYGLREHGGAKSPGLCSPARASRRAASRP
jgi:hypothetical protein